MNPYNHTLTTVDFNKLSAFIYHGYGIKIPPVKKTLLESRLQTRINLLQLNSFKDYCDFVFSPKGQQLEVVHMIDLVTTNKTDFFREPDHFTFLQSYALPEFSKKHPGRSLHVWSAGCSSGEEAYTLAIVLSEYAQRVAFDFKIYATDISTQVLNKAITAIYSEERVATIPLQLKRKYFLKSRNVNERLFRVIPTLRAKVGFGRLNFMEDRFDAVNNFDIIFCRNVLIYFDKPTQEKVINKLCLKLKPGGYFLLGHSESITHMDLPLEQVKPTIFRKK